MKNEKMEMTVEKKQKKKNTFLKVIGIILCVLSVLVLVGLGIYHGVLNYYLNKINIVTEEEEISFVTQRLTEEIPETLEETSTEEELPETEEIDLHGTFGTGELPLICDTKKVTNILLLATDSRAKGGAGRTDVMMLVSINEETGKIVLCSFLRDLYAHYPSEPKNPISGGYDKLNHAHAYGGPALTMAVLKETFNIDVKHYAKVDFSAFVQVVDALGGLDIYLTTGEIGFINRLEKANSIESHLTGYVPSPLPVTEGVHHINGVQALTHARNRTIGSDFQRTQRQRTLISAMVSKAGTLSLSQINHLLEVLLPLVTTNMQKDTMKDLIAKVPAMIGYSVESTKIPQEGTYQSIRYNLIPDLKKNCYPLYEMIYGQPPAVVE
ncbi:MAG: LCP family protein [Clostridia bacterium]|nr:LCP family protein [Clostridia bacterium]